MKKKIKTLKQASWTQSIYFLTLICFVFSHQLYSQQTISGQLLNANEQPVDFANILLLNANDSSLVKGTLTDSTGQYFFERVAKGKFIIAAKMIGLGEVYSTVFEVAQIGIQVPTLQFSADGVALDEVVVRAKKPFIEMKADKLVVNVASSPSSAGNTALELLEKAPGVTIDNEQNIALKGKQGVLVMIDGKQSYLSAQEVSRMLETMPASSIETIEIINNPSARYDAAGNAGIINITLKKDKNLGFNGDLTLGSGYGKFPKANGSLNLNYRTKKLNLFGDYNYWYNEKFQNLNLFRIIGFDGMTTNFDQNSYWESTVKSHRYKAGADWYVGNKTTLGVLVQGRTGTYGQDLSNTTLLTGDNIEDFSTVSTESDAAEGWENYTYNVNLQHKFDEEGRTLSVDADYSQFGTNQAQNYANFFLNGEQQVAPPNLLKSDNYSGVNIKALKVDYTHPLANKAKIETGLKSSLVTTDNNIEFWNLYDTDWLTDSTRSNQFIYKENIHAAYLNYSQQFDKVQVQAGLRGEYTFSDGISVTLGEQLTRGYFNLFPSFSLSHQINDKHSMSYSYSRRIDRPTYQNLNPFVYFLDQYTFEKGNPFLQPQLTNAVSVTYGFKQFAYLTVSYSHTKDAMTEILEQIDSLNLTFQTKANLASFDNLAFNLSSPIPIADWWNARVNLSTYYNRFQSELNGSMVDNASWAFNGYMSNQFSLPKGWRAEVSGWYQSPMIYGIMRMKAQYSVNVGLNKKILDGNGSLRISANDIFNTQQFRGEFLQDNINVTVNNKWESRRIFVSMSYKFGNTEMQQARRRKTATEDEQNRVKGSN